MGYAGSAIRDVREAQDLSLRKLAGLAGIHPTYLSQIERGTRNPSVRVLRDIERALGEYIASGITAEQP